MPSVSGLPERAWLVDASIYIFRAWFSLPDQWHTREGQPLSALYGYAKFLLEFVAGRGAGFYGALAFDESLGTNYRNAIYPAYKSSRALPDESLAFQLSACREFSQLLGFACFGCERYEADDYLYVLAARYREEGVAVTVVTRDKDLGQLLQYPDDEWWDYAGDARLNRTEFASKYGVKPEQFADYLALVGDPIDDIPGVPGIGAKTAAALLQRFHSLDELEHRMEEVLVSGLRGSARVKAQLEAHWQQVLMSRRLTGLADTIPQVNALQALPAFALQEQSVLEARAFLEVLNLQGPLTRRCDQLAQSLAASRESN